MSQTLLQLNQGAEKLASFTVIISQNYWRGTSFDSIHINYKLGSYHLSTDLVNVVHIFVPFLCLSS